VARRIVVPSERTKQDVMVELGVDAARIRVVPLGVRRLFGPVTDEGTLAAVRRRYELSERFFLFVGNVEPKKNLAGIARAFAQYVAEGGPPADLVVAGAMGWAPRRLFERLEPGEAAGRLRWIGYVSDSDLPALYSMATALLFPSLYEGFGLPPLEAMACGTPAIVSDRGALPEVVGDAAPVVRLHEVSSELGPIGIAEELPQTMRRIAEDDAYRRKLMAAGLERAQRFTWSRHAEAVARLYDEVAEEGGTEH
jgi:glycosyltransferase involved in cell wall biosynthesis